MTQPAPMPYCVEIRSRNCPVDFGDGVVVVGRGFWHWLPLVRGMELLSPNRVMDRAILDDLASFEAEIATAHPFEAGDTCIDIDRLPADQMLLAHTNPAALIDRLRQAPLVVIRP